MGAAASTIPQIIDKPTFQRISGGTINDAIFDKHAVNGFLTKEKLLELAQVRDALLCHDIDSIDCLGRDIHHRVLQIEEALRNYGIFSFINRDRNSGAISNQVYTQSLHNAIIKEVTEVINHSRCLICFFTHSFLEKLFPPPPPQLTLSNSHLISQSSALTPQPKCLHELNVMLSLKHPNFIIPIFFEPGIPHPSQWPGNIGLAFREANIMNWENDDNFMEKIDELQSRIKTIASINNNNNSSNNVNKHTTLLSLKDKSREEQQFFQWLARNTNISETNRLIYCATFIKNDIKNIFTLANLMNQHNNYLLTIGINERDSDEIAYAISNLNLGYNPIKNFNQVLTIDSILYAIDKAIKNPEDNVLAESALLSVGRLAISNSMISQRLLEGNIIQALFKIIQQNLTQTNVMIASMKGIGALIEGPNGKNLINMNEEEYYNNNNTEFDEKTQIPIPTYNLAFLNNGFQPPQYYFSNNTPLIFPPILPVSESINFLVSRINQNMSLKIGEIGGCEILSLILKSHLNSISLIYYATRNISNLSLIPVNRNKLSQTNIPDTLVKSIKASLSNSFTCGQILQTINNICYSHIENISKISMAGGCNACIEVLYSHSNNPFVIENAFRLMTTLAGENTGRSTLGSDPNCARIIIVCLGNLVNRIVNPQYYGEYLNFNQGQNHSQVQVDQSNPFPTPSNTPSISPLPSIQYGCEAIAAIITGNAYNRNLLGQFGACEIVKHIAFSVPYDPILYQSISRAVFALAAGNLDHKNKLQGVQAPLYFCLNQRNTPDNIRKEINEALSKLK